MTLSQHDIFTEFYVTELERFQQNICNGCGMSAGDADSSGHLVPSLWDLHMFYLLRPILFELVVILPDYALRISLGTFSILLFTSTHVPLLVDKLSPRVLVG